MTNHEGNWYVLVAAFHPPKEGTGVAPGLAIRPLPTLLSVFDLAAAGAAGFSAWAAIEPLSKYCWAEIESAKDAEAPPGYDTLNRAWLMSSLLVLRGFTPLRSYSVFGVFLESHRWVQSNTPRGDTTHVATVQG